MGIESQYFFRFLPIAAELDFARAVSAILTEGG